eukprot:NODE_63_length_26141_cov_1.022656.p12 type:complete len:276 gc:universal NODE_63_length_26141_cov_1.022656:2941-2114(-)
MDKEKSKSRKFIAGALAGAIEAFITYPTEFVKTNTQLKKEKPILILKRTIATKGIQSIYKGVDIHIAGTALKAGVRFYSYGYFKDLLTMDGNLSKPNLLLSGLLSGVTEAIIAVTPSETIKTKLIHDSRRENPKFHGMIDGISKIIKAEGLKGVYRGLMPVIMRQGANQMIRFTTYAMLKEEADKREMKNGFVIFGLGFIAGSITTFATMPFDVVKTRMQGFDAHRYKNLFHCGYVVVKESGVGALWSGMLPRLCRVSMSGGIVFFFYEKILKLI